MSVTHEPTTTDEDEGYIPPAVHVEHVDRYCPACGRPLAKHKMLELLRCQSSGGNSDIVLPPPLPPAPPKPPAPLPPRIGPDVASLEERLERRVEQNHKPPPNAEPEPPNEYEQEVSEWVEVSEGLPPRELPRLPNGEIDYVSLAAGMRAVLEKERDEMVKRGGPIEKQNIDLKVRLASALDDVAMWRRRAQANAEARNLAQRTIDEQTKTIRQLRNELKGRKESGNLVRVLEIDELIRIAESTSGWVVKRTGAGHYAFEKNGVFVTDAASSGGGAGKGQAQQKVNMATRLKLKKAGLNV